MDLSNFSRLGDSKNSNYEEDDDSVSPSRRSIIEREAWRLMLQKEIDQQVKERLEIDNINKRQEAMKNQYLKLDQNPIRQIRDLQQTGDGTNTINHALPRNLLSLSTSDFGNKHLTLDSTFQRPTKLNGIGDSMQNDNNKNNKNNNNVVKPCDKIVQNNRNANEIIICQNNNNRTDQIVNEIRLDTKESNAGGNMSRNTGSSLQNSRSTPEIFYRSYNNNVAGTIDPLLGIMDPINQVNSVSGSRQGSRSGLGNHRMSTLEDLSAQFQLDSSYPSSNSNNKLYRGQILNRNGSSHNNYNSNHSHLHLNGDLEMTPPTSTHPFNQPSAYEMSFQNSPYGNKIMSRYSLLSNNTNPAQINQAKVAQIRAARVRERQKLIEQSEQLQRKLIIKQGDLANSPSKNFLEKLNSFGINKPTHVNVTNPYLNLISGGASSLTPGVMSKPLHPFNMTTWDNNNNSNSNNLAGNNGTNNQIYAKIYTRYYITEVIKQGGFAKSQLTDTKDDCYAGEFVDTYGIALSHDGPFWPSGISPFTPLPNNMAKLPKEIEAKHTTQGTHNNNSNEKIEPYQSTTSEKLETLPYFNRPEASFHPNEKEYDYLKSGRHYVYDTDKVEYGNINSTPQIVNNTNNNHPGDICSDDHLIFDSMFESGNLRSARRVGQRAYELIMNTDRYTQRHTQWFFFSISNIRYKNYKFFLINFHKKDSLYNYGMQPVVYINNKWKRFGTAVKYCPYYPATLYGGTYASCHNNQLSIERQYYALVLEIGPFNKKPLPDEKVFISHCYPYTYTNLRRHIQALSKLPEVDKILRVETLCRTMAGNNCYILTITDFENDDNIISSSENEETHEKNPYFLPPNKRKLALITGRVHPGESQASWMIHGFIKFMLSDHVIAKYLRSVLIFKIVPMINIDGVIVGNYRTSLAAKDLNRNYRFPRQDVFPVIWYIKEVLRQSRRSGRVNQFYIDMHGHSRKKSSFMYGCCDPNLKMQPDEDFMSFQERKLEYNIQQRMLPWLIGQRANELFNFDYCAYSMRKSKESTGRIVMYREFGIRNSLTLEATFAGTSDNWASHKDSKIHRQFNQKDFMNIGKHTAEALWDYHVADIDMEKKSKLFEDIAQHLQRQMGGYSSSETMESTPSKNNNNNGVSRKNSVISPPSCEIDLYARSNSNTPLQSSFIPVLDENGDIEIQTKHQDLRRRNKNNYQNDDRVNQKSPSVQRCLKILGPNLSEILENLEKGVDLGDLSQMKPSSLNEVLEQSPSKNKDKFESSKSGDFNNKKSLPNGGLGPKNESLHHQIQGTNSKISIRQNCSSAGSGDDSDSESEPELIINNEKLTTKPKPKKSKKKNKKNKKSSTQKNLNNNLNNATKNETSQPITLKDSKSSDSLIKTASIIESHPFEDPYAKRKGNGQAFFTAERARKNNKKEPIHHQSNSIMSALNSMGLTDFDSYEKIDAAYVMKSRAERQERERNKETQSYRLGTSDENINNASGENQNKTKILNMQNFRFPSIDVNNSGVSDKKSSHLNNGWNPYSSSSHGNNRNFPTLPFIKTTKEQVYDSFKYQNLTSQKNSNDQPNLGPYSSVMMGSRPSSKNVRK